LVSTCGYIIVEVDSRWESGDNKVIRVTEVESLRDCGKGSRRDWIRLWWFCYL